MKISFGCFTFHAYMCPKKPSIPKISELLRKKIIMLRTVNILAEEYNFTCPITHIIICVSYIFTCYI